VLCDDQRQTEHTRGRHREGNTGADPRPLARRTEPRGRAEHIQLAGEFRAFLNTLPGGGRRG
jgi:hypothetical protein